MDAPDPGVAPFIPIADIEVDAVVRSRVGFLMEGRGADGADYKVELHFDLPVDHQTHRVLGELLSQCDMKISRRSGANPLRAARATRARQRG